MGCTDAGDRPTRVDGPVDKTRWARMARTNRSGRGWISNHRPADYEADLGRLTECQGVSGPIERCSSSHAVSGSLRALMSRLLSNPAGRRGRVKGPMPMSSECPELLAEQDGSIQPTFQVDSSGLSEQPRGRRSRSVVPAGNRDWSGDCRLARKRPDVHGRAISRWIADSSGLKNQIVV